MSLSRSIQTLLLAAAVATLLLLIPIDLHASASVAGSSLLDAASLKFTTLAMLIAGLLAVAATQTRRLAYKRSR